MKLSRDNALTLIMILMVVSLAFYIGTLATPAPEVVETDPWASFDVRQAEGVYIDVNGDGQQEFVLELRYVAGASLLEATPDPIPEGER